MYYYIHINFIYYIYMYCFSAIQHTYLNTVANYKYKNIRIRIQEYK